MDLNIDYHKYTSDLIDWAVTFSPKLLLAMLLAYFGFKIVARLSKVFEATLKSSDIAPDFISFLSNTTDVLLKLGLILICISILGVEMSSLVALIAAAGFAVGLALQGFLGNFASGLTIVFFKPYKIGDWVSIAGTFGKVKSIQIFNTILLTPGDKTIVIPNGKVTDDAVTNFSTEGKLRLEMYITMPYAESFPRVKEIIYNTLKSCNFVLKTPEPVIGIEKFESHNIVISIRPYILPDDYWTATFEVNEKIKSAFSQHDVSIAYSDGVELGIIGE
jgi:small conductance mechanosensitive channel